MPVCPFCKLSVSEFKTNSHVLPRAWAKRTKINGQNIYLNLKDSKIAVNQTDYADDYWCEDCENESAKDDSYGAGVLLHGTRGKIVECKGKKINWKEISAVDHSKFRKFILSIVIRDYLARSVKGHASVVSVVEFEQLRENYCGGRDDIYITGSYILDSDPLSKAIHGPTRTRNNDGVNFQLFNFCFLIYFSKIDIKLEPISLKKTGEMRLGIVTADQIGSWKDMPSEHQKIVNDPKNKKQLEKIAKKYR